MVHWSIGSVVIGTSILVPGPIDALAAGIGLLIFKHPIGALIGIGVYNAIGLGFVGLGLSGVLNEVGHRQKTSLDFQSNLEITKWGAGYCDPDDPPWWC